MADYFFVKSLEEDFFTKTLKGKNKVNFQFFGDMVKTRTIRPNTKSFGQMRRLSTTILHKNYLKTYRSQGIIFQTKDKPSYVIPFDLVLLSSANKILVQYYRIKNNLHLYYNHELIKGYEKFIFKDFSKLIKRFPAPKEIWKEVNVFRKKAGYAVLPLSKYRLVEYNEAVFEKTIRITPVAVFGYTKKARALAKQYALPHFRTTREFYNKSLHTSLQI